MAGKYVPDAGDVVWLQFDPQLGREQRGHRPALVISPAAYNGKTNLMVCCPMTSHIKGYPFEVAIDGEESSVVLADQVKSLDWTQRQAVFKKKVSPATLSKVRRKIYALLGQP
ncbi:endoribonuclease MazF [Magnetospirillum sp. 15-1]|uniref:endoribonuclease MazF n=1 Tax=Magnetospirillum sp. 15-1 TaxID=1979370 RepID=UPI000BBCC1BC|nr:endoribonuclease MazF [Magnetospirillum sp. 15-1]